MARAVAGSASRLGPAVTTAIIIGAAVLAVAIYAKGIRMSAATDRLAASVQAVSASVDALVARAQTIPAPPLDETPLTQAADLIDGLKSKIDSTLPTP